MTQKLVVGIQALAERLQVSKATISLYIRLGLPCARIGNRWHFHTDNVDNFFRALTNKQYKNEANPQDLETEG